MTRKSVNSWIQNEFKSISFGDKRIDTRFNIVASDALDNPSARINVASEDWAATKAAYRFFANPKVTGKKIFDCHSKCTINRLQKHKNVIAIHDTTPLDFSNHTKLKGKGPIGTRQQKMSGYFLHSTLIASTDGLPLGLGYHDLWARDENKKSTPAKNKKLPIEKKESYKWIKSIEAINKFKLGDTEIIHVADREADFYDFFDAIERLGEKVIIRARYDRELLIEENEEQKSEENEKKKMWDFMLEQPVCFEESIKVSRNHLFVKGKNKKEQKVERTTIVEIRVGQITLKPPAYMKNKIPLIFNLVLVKEVNCPEGTVPVEWMLITNLPLESKEEISKIISYYRVRWIIEEYHKILKTGCSVEDCLLESTEAIFKYVTLFSIIAWRLFWITRLQRIDPNLPCTQGIAEVEWKALYCYLHRSKNAPDEIPTIREVTIWLACLGGFLARKGDGDPGIITVWRGWTRLNDIVSTYELFK